jgi:hypothetical protein
MAGPRDPYEIGRSLGIKDPSTLNQWVQQYGPPSDPPQAAAAPNYTPASQEQPPPDEDPTAGATESPNPFAYTNPAGQKELRLREESANEERKKAAAEAERFYGPDSPQAKAARDAVKVLPGEVGAPDDPRKGATPLVPEDQWLPKSAGGGAPVMVSPGGRREHSWTVTQGLALPGTMQALANADKSERDAAVAGRDAGIRDADREMAYLDRHEQIQAQRAVQLKWQAEDRARRLEAETDKLATMTDAVRADKIDNNQWFTGHGAAGAFAAGLAYTLGAVGGALTHTENPVLGVIRQEIQTQKDNIALRRGKLDEQKGLLAQLTKTFGDKDVGEQAAWVMYLERAKTQMARIAAESKSDAVRARYKTAIAGIDTELTPRVMKLEEMMQDKVVRQDVNAPPVYAGVGGGGKKHEPVDPLFVATDSHGGGFNARSEKEATAARGVITAEQDIIPMLERLKELRKKTSFIERRADNTGQWETEDTAEMKSLQAQVALGLRELSTSSPGAMDKGMQDLANQIQGNWMSVQGHPEKAADSFIASIRRKKDSMMRGQGAQAQRQGLKQDAAGNVTTGLQGQPKFATPKPESPKTFKGVE